MISWIIDNWYIGFGLLTLGAVLGISVKRFLELPNNKQVKNVKEWLLYAVTIAEKELGSGTGKIKLRSVYDAFLIKFPWLAKLVSFDTFSVWVDDALEEMRVIIENNDNVAKLVTKE